MNEARKLFRDFHGDEPGSLQKVRLNVPKTGLVIGKLDGVLYTAVRDGKTEKYIHKFTGKSAPLLVSDPKGASLHIVGGRYVFEERGIVDRK